MFRGTIPSFGGHFDKRSPETSRCVNATVGDPISCIILCVGVESAAGAFQDSHDGGAEADILGHTLQYTPHVGHYFHTIGPRMVACRDSMWREATFLNNFVGKPVPVLQRRMWLYSPQIPNPTLQNESSVQAEKENCYSLHAASAIAS
jgi:hypothetical protein